MTNSKKMKNIRPDDERWTEIKKHLANVPIDLLWPKGFFRSDPAYISAGDVNPALLSAGYLLLDLKLELDALRSDDPRTFDSRGAFGLNTWEEWGALTEKAGIPYKRVSEAMAAAMEDKVNKRTGGRRAVVFGPGPEDMIVAGEPTE
jgi:hypothetical protein